MTTRLIDQVQTGKQYAPRRIMLYGIHGVGKSTWGASSPAPIFIQTEDGLGGIDCARFPLATRYADVINALSALYTEQHSYRTVVLDSLDWLERLIWAVQCEAKGIESIEDIPYGKGYVFALTQWREVLEGLNALRNDCGMTVILIAHAKVERYENPETESYDRYVPRLHRQAAAMVQEWCDEVLFATYRVHIQRVDEGFGQTRTVATGTGERVMRTSERPAHVAKNRLSLPGELPLSWTEYARYLPNATGEISAPATEAPSVQTAEPSVEVPAGESVTPAVSTRRKNRKEV